MDHSSGCHIEEKCDTEINLESTTVQPDLDNNELPSTLGTEQLGQCASDINTVSSFMDERCDICHEFTHFHDSLTKKDVCTLNAASPSEQLSSNGLDRSSILSYDLVTADKTACDGPIPIPIKPNLATAHINKNLTTPFDSDVLSTDESHFATQMSLSKSIKVDYPDELNPFSEAFLANGNKANSYTGIPCVFETHSMCSATKDRPSRRCERETRARSPATSTVHSICDNGTPEACSDKLSSFKSRSSSTNRVSNCARRDFSNMETRSMILKRPAPPLPVPQKRIIKADNEEGFVDYCKLHENLYNTNIRLSEIEREMRVIQLAIKEVSESPGGNVQPLMKKWLHFVDLKDSLFNEHQKLVQRLRSQELEEQHSNVEHELRTLLAKQDVLKTDDERARETALLSELVDTVNKRAALVDEVKIRSSTNAGTSSKRKWKKFVCFPVLKPKHPGQSASSTDARHSIYRKQFPPAQLCMRKQQTATDS